MLGAKGGRAQPARPDNSRPPARPWHVTHVGHAGCVTVPPSRRRWQVAQVAAGRRARPRTVTRVEWPTAEPIDTARLTLEPLRVHHASKMADVLADPRLYEYVGGAPASVAKLEARYALQAVGHSPDGHQGWLNWIVRERATGAVVGTVQATLTDVGGRLAAEIAWVIGSAYQRRGYATEAAGAMVEWLRGHATNAIVAHIHADHEASIRVARRLGLTPTDILEGGETRWVAAAE